MPALVTNSKIWEKMFGTKEMHFLFSMRYYTVIFRCGSGFSKITVKVEYYTKRS